jgi:molybdopterin synthase catalytic subunit
VVASDGDGGGSALHSPPDRRYRLTDQPLDPTALAALVSQSATGAVTSFVGLVRDHNAGRRVFWIDYEGYGRLAERVFARIGDEAGGRWPDVALAIHHRVGRLEVGEASVAIAAAAPHRTDAFAACRFAIERIKQIAPVWKHEHVDGGDVWIEGAVADPDDEKALREAFERACA